MEHEHGTRRVKDGALSTGYRGWRRRRADGTRARNTQGEGWSTEHGVQRMEEEEGGWNTSTRMDHGAQNTSIGAIDPEQRTGTELGAQARERAGRERGARSTGGGTSGEHEQPAVAAPAVRPPIYSLRADLNGSSFIFTADFVLAAIVT